jgi:glycosyltransferase involved in cell wall biosynthesis
VGAVAEFAVNRQNALVIQPCDVRGMADALEGLLLSPQLRADLSHRGLKTAAQYALTRNAPLFADALRRILKGESNHADGFERANVTE